VHRRLSTTLLFPSFSKFYVDRVDTGGPVTDYTLNCTFGKKLPLRTYKLLPKSVKTKNVKHSEEKKIFHLPLALSIVSLGF
jgi:hypothetical protein